MVTNLLEIIEEPIVALQWKDLIRLCQIRNCMKCFVGVFFLIFVGVVWQESGS
jgi:hypothetical protein